MLCVVDLGSQYTHLINRRVRELGVRGEIIPWRDFKPREDVDGVILSGGPRSVYEEDAPTIDRSYLDELSDRGVPVLGICYGHQLLAQLYGGRVERGAGEFGVATLYLRARDQIFKGLRRREKVWMSHRDQVVEPPGGSKVLAYTRNTRIAAFRLPNGFYGVQFHPEVKHTPRGRKVLDNFLTICRARRDWNMMGYAEEKIEEVRRRVGRGKVLVAVSGGVDSMTAALLMKRAVGDGLEVLFVNTGLLREDEPKEVLNILKRMGFRVRYIDASYEFLKALRGVVDPEEKRRIIAEKFAEIFSRESRGFEFIGQGTIYPDRIESAASSRAAHRIKSHHNVVMPDTGRELIEPLSGLYKDEVRELARMLGLPRKLVERHPFPGPGLAIRIVGEVTEDKLRMLRKADKIVEEEMRRSGYYRKVWQAFPVLLSLRSVGVQGDRRTYEYMIALRIVKSADAMTASFAKLPWSLMEKISSRIVNEVEGVNRVLYDVTNKPPATIEFE